MPTFGERLKTLRGPMKQPALAKEADVAQTTISAVERGEHLPTDAVFLKLCAALRLNRETRRELYLLRLERIESEAPPKIRRALRNTSRNAPDSP